MTGSRVALAKRMMEYYETSATYHSDVTVIAGSRPSAEELTLFEALVAACPKSADKRVLELGCGRCESAAKLMEMLGGGDYHGMDASPEALAFAKLQHPSFTLQAGDISKLPHAANSFDVVFLNCVLEHTCEPSLVLDEALRVLRPGGVIGMIVPVSDLPWLTPPSLRHRAKDPAFLVPYAIGRWAHFLKLRYSPSYFSFPLVYEPIVLAQPGSQFGPDDDQVYLGSTLEIVKYLRSKHCEIVLQVGRDISSVISNGRRPVVDALRSMVFLGLRCSLARFDVSSFTTTVTIVARKPD